MIWDNVRITFVSETDKPGLSDVTLLLMMKMMMTEQHIFTGCECVCALLKPLYAKLTALNYFSR